MSKTMTADKPELTMSDPRFRPATTLDAWRPPFFIECEAAFDGKMSGLRSEAERLREKIEPIASDTRKYCAIVPEKFHAKAIAQRNEIIERELAGFVDRYIKRMRALGVCR